MIEEDKKYYTSKDMWDAMLWANSKGGHLTKHNEYLDSVKPVYLSQNIECRENPKTDPEIKKAIDEWCDEMAEENKEVEEEKEDEVKEVISEEDFLKVMSEKKGKEITSIDEILKINLTGREFFNYINALFYEILISLTEIKKVECKEKEETELQKMTNDRNCLWEANESLLAERNALQDRLNNLEEKEDKDELWIQAVIIFEHNYGFKQRLLEKLKEQFSISKK